MARRGCREAIPIAGGWALRHPGLPDAYQLNRIHLSAGAPAPSADALIALADAWQAGLAHRRVTLEDAEAGERLTDALAAHGYERLRTLYMALAADRLAVAPDPRARALSEPELAALQERVFAADAGPRASAAGVPARLAAAQAALRTGTPATGFGAGPEPAAEPVAAATLFCDPDVAGRRVALIDQVATLRPYRQQGLGRAVTLAAIAAAQRWGAELIVVPVDADDWPQLMYAGLGFVALGRQITFTRRGSGGSRV